MADEYITRAEHTAFSELMDAENHRIHDENNRQNARLKKLEDMMDNFQKVQASMEKMETIMQSTLAELERQGKRLERLELRDGEMWRKVTGYIITAVVGIVIGFVFKKIGM